MSNHILTVSGVLVLLAFSPASAQQDKARASNMSLVGYNDLQARSAYQPVIEKQGARWIAYIGHHGGEQLNPMTGKVEQNGTSVVDVTDPKAPKYLAHIPGEGKEHTGESGGASMVRVCSGNELPHGVKNKFYMLRAYGNSAHEMWDVTDPAKPTRMNVIVGGLRDTHKSWWECDTGIAYLVSGVVGWRVPRMAQIYDLSDPAKPVFIRNFGLPGQQPGAKGPTPESLHGPVSTGPKGNRVYFAYGNARAGVIEIVDRQKLLNGPKEPTDENLRYPIISKTDLPSDVGAHNIFPMLQMSLSEFAKQKSGKTKDFLAVIGETTPNECQESRQMMRLFDVTDEAAARGRVDLDRPRRQRQFLHGRRTLRHAFLERELHADLLQSRRCSSPISTPACARSTFAIPISRRKSAITFPAITDKTDKRCVGQGADEHCKIAIQTNNVEVDDRGYIYAVDRANTGMHILELTGPARQVANFPR